MMQATPRVRLVLFALVALGLSTSARPSDADAGTAAPAPALATPPSDATYRLAVRDQVEISIFDEPSLTVAQHIDNSGRVSLALVGPATIAGMTVREAEEFVARQYIENRLLRRPMATVRITEYAPREVSVIGAVVSPGMLVFPRERASLDIVEVISRCGGLSRRANGRRVQVTRTGPDGGNTVTEVNVDGLIEKGRGENLEIRPGDVIFVPERGF
jgi:polysaccharide export outer membrane protein